ncbi:MAG: ribonuclease HII [Gemmatimonadetes bacterium]|nr:ribonuclease HII [Gemmatimonadota bacterium]
MALESASRLQDPLAYEWRFWSRGVHVLAGVDEAGRGPLAGPVLAAAVVLRPGVPVPGATDSKKLAPEERESLNQQILRSALAVALGAASAREIDRINIRRATALAMSRALARLALCPDHVVIDGLPVPELGWEHEAIVDGDRIVHSVACASIVAKVCRDRLMRRLAARYPGYGWHTNVGYATEEHREALRRLGPTPHHRLTYGGVQLDLGL